MAGKKKVEDKLYITPEPHIASGYAPSGVEIRLSEINNTLMNLNARMDKIIEHLDSLALAAVCFHCKDIRNGIKSCPFCQTTVGIKPKSESNG